MKLASKQSFTGVLLGLAIFILGACSDNAAPASLAVSPAISSLPTVVGPTVRTSSGLKYVDIRIGNGNEAKAGKMVTINYTGYLSDGHIFDSTLDHGQPYLFKLGEGMHLKGLEEGIIGMRVGGGRRLIIPPELGYGSRGKDPIPPNATLTFDVDLLRAK